MELNEYQKRAMKTCMPTCRNFGYMMLNLVGEVGEFSGKVAKAIRKDLVFIGHPTTGMKKNEESNLCNGKKSDVFIHAELKEEMEKEAGDILWQLSGLCEIMGWSLEDVAKMNLEKLASRKKRGVIDGNGDNR